MYVIKRRSIKPRRIRIDSNTLEAIRHPDLFDSLFKTQSSWVASIVWLKAVFGDGSSRATDKIRANDL